MEQEQQILFGPFRFDRALQRLWQGSRDIRIRSKTLAALQYLLASPGRVIPRQEFAQHVWGQTHVTRSVLRVCIWELRQALGDAGPTPQYIETVGQQGYRWCAPTRQTGSDARPEVPFVGRQAEMAALHTALDQAQRGTLQLVFVTGDPGIGKTTLVHQFLSQVATPTPLWIGRGQCVEHVGGGEAYLPFLDALGRLEHAPGGIPQPGARAGRGVGAALCVRPGGGAGGPVSAVCGRAGAPPQCVYGGRGALPPGAGAARGAARTPRPRRAGTGPTAGLERGLDRHAGLCLGGVGAQSAVTPSRSVKRLRRRRL